MPDLPSLFGQLPRVRTWSRLGLCVLAGLLGLIDLRATGRASAGDRPNVLFIAVDDLRPEFGAYGAPHVHSPHLDRLARSGVTFLRAYCQQAVCSPSRSSVLTGARPDTTRVYDLNTHFRTALPQVVTLGEHFKNHGYFVQGVGKIYHPGFDDTPTWSVPWHTPTAPTYALPESEPASNEPASNEPASNEPAGQKNDPDQPAGPSDAGAPTGAPPAADPAPQAGSPAQPRRAGPPGRARRRRAANAASPQQSANTPTANTPGANTPKKNANRRPNAKGLAFEAADVPDHTFRDARVADAAIRILEQRGDQAQPFFLAVGFAKPHLPFVAPRRYWDLYPPGELALAPNPFRPEGAPPYAIGPGGELHAYRGIPREIPDELARQLKHGYYAALSYMDAQLGRVLDALDRLGLRENTLIVLWGDHGWKLGEHAAWCKHSNCENDTRVPLLVSGPGVKHPGVQTSGLVELVDLYPSLCDLAGLPLPEHLEGTSFRGLLDQPNREWKRAALSQYPRTHAGEALMGYSLRTATHRFTAWVRRNRPEEIVAVELYDHTVDPQENTNLASREETRALQAELLKLHRAGWRGARPGF